MPPRKRRIEGNGLGNNLFPSDILFNNPPILFITPNTLIYDLRKS
jgi:hypothetical protein